LNSDHTNGTRPGVPTPRAMVADNDLALGRIVEGISRSRFWARSLILVVEDDAQDGVDHVDGRRTIALAIGPGIRRNAVDSNNYNHTSMIRTIQEIFRIPQRTRALQSARAMTSLFTAEKDVSPYQRLEPKVALDEMNPPLKALAGRQLWAAKQSLAMNWKDIDDAPANTLNRILWWDAKGWNAPYPAEAAGPGQRGKGSR
jgi:Phosphoesterase family